MSNVSVRLHRQEQFRQWLQQWLKKKKWGRLGRRVRQRVLLVQHLKHHDVEDKNVFKFYFSLSFLSLLFSVSSFFISW